MVSQQDVKGYIKELFLLDNEVGIIEFKKSIIEFNNQFESSSAITSF